MKYFFLFILSFNLHAKEFVSEGKTFKFNWLDDEFSEPLWGIDNLSKDVLVITGKRGSVWKFDLTKKIKTKMNIRFPNLFVGGQGGLLDVKAHNKDLYFSYSYEDKKGRTTAFRKLSSTGKEETFYISNAYSNNRHHFGSRFEIIDNDLYATIGDRGERYKAQNQNVDNGKILKFSLNKLNKPETFSLGHRNPQGIAYNTEWKSLINGEFGPQGGDEINHIKAKLNYGWPIITYGEEYGGGKIGKKTKKGLEQPIKYWTPSLSFSGIGFYTSDKVPEWKNNLFLACLRTQKLHRVILSPKLKVIKEESLLVDLRERIRMVREGLNGELFIITDSGKLGVITRK